MILKFYFINILNFVPDSDNSNAEDGPSDADFWKADEKSRLVWCSELAATETYRVHSELQDSVSISVHT